ncbi:hypothetical protein NKR23_g5772 [Pleurostoma richardsiae]|uniref:Heterokaryon incompatibility domain-containing protein n=1 Tax=Pleurostoma richardsiae TaxID=41990 RepID=A0AA38RRF9_9PEZI|nr:hypothetical protein NKR23_g5772 [Pleurostoma richardsiae]
MEQPTHLCRVCREAFSREHDCDRSYQHHETAESFHEAKQLGCHLCSVLWEASDAIPPDKKWDFGKARQLNVTYKLPSDMSSIDFHFDAEDYKAAFVSITLRPVTDIPSSPLEADSSLGDNERAVLGLGVQSSMVKESPRHSSQHGSWTYDTMTQASYAWGVQHKPPMLLRANVARRKAGIPLGELPGSFRDAVQVARHLGVDWLWIDSLCIIQDSADDWRRESARMGRIYSDSLCNVAATGAADNGGGLFPDGSIVARQLFLNLSILRRRDDGEPEVPGPRDSRAFHRYRLEPWSLWARRVEEAGLNNRGWVVQERVLAPRTLHFTTTQVFWECTEIAACESLPDSLSPDHDDPETYFILIRKILAAARMVASTARHSTAKISVNDWTDMRDAWRQLTHGYMRCLLTKEEDRLVALSGIAKEIRSMTGDEYIAGNWKSSLITDLLWYSMRDGTRLARTRPLVAPTWSWASIRPHAFILQYQGRTHNDPEPLHLIEFLGSTIDPYTADDTGQLRSAFIRVRGRLFPDVSEVSRSNGSCNCRECKSKSEHFPRNSDAVDIDGTRFFHDELYHDEDDLAESADSSLEVMYMPVVVDRRLILEQDIEIRMLLLTPGPKHGTYERIGMCKSLTKLPVTADGYRGFTVKYLQNYSRESVIITLG